MRLLLAALAAACAVASAAEEAIVPGPLRDLQADLVEEVVFCRSGMCVWLRKGTGQSVADAVDAATDTTGIFLAGSLFPLGYSVKDSKSIAQLVNVLRSSSFGDEPDYPFVGILSYQVFLGKGRRVLAVAHIVNWRACVRLESGFEVDGRMYCGQKTGQDGEIAVGYGNREYCRLVYGLMQEHLPGTVAELNRMYQQSHGKTLADLLLTPAEAATGNE